MNTPRAEPIKLYTSRQVWIADVVSLSLLGGAILMAVNCVRLGNRAGARVALSWGVVGTAALLAFVKPLSSPSPFPVSSWLALFVVSVAMERLVSVKRECAAARRVAEAAGTPSSWVAAGIGLACSVVLIAVIGVVELNGRLSTFVEHLFESRLTTEQRLDRLADLPVDRTINVSGSIAWMRRCKATTPADTVPYDHMCVANDSNVVMLVGTLRGLLHTVYAAQVGTERVDLAAWARRRFGVPSGFCVRDTGGVNLALTWWTRPRQTIVAATISGPEHFVMRALSLVSRRFDNEVPSCDEDAGPDVLRPKPLNPR